ncbi:hypothetical protein [Candidatus Nitrosocosmicus arcticus]|nr:hypothetical protein [Candidatus Nitrosocosmicus arcticus]
MFSDEDNISVTNNTFLEGSDTALSLVILFAKFAHSVPDPHLTGKFAF